MFLSVKSGTIVIELSEFAVDHCKSIREWRITESKRTPLLAAVHEATTKLRECGRTICGRDKRSSKGGVTLTIIEMVGDDKHCVPFAIGTRPVTT